MVAFDTVLETFRRIPPPSPLDFPRKYHDLRAFDMDVRPVGGGAGFLAHGRVGSRGRRRPSAGGSWACLLRIDLPPPRRVVPDLRGCGFSPRRRARGGGLPLAAAVRREGEEGGEEGQLRPRHPQPEPVCLQGEPRAPAGAAPDARPCPRDMPSGKPLLHYFSSDDDAKADTSKYGNLRGDTWIV